MFEAKIIAMIVVSNLLCFAIGVAITANALRKR